MTTTTTVGAASARLSYARPVSSRRPKPGRHRSHRARTLPLLDLENLVDGYVAYESVESVWNEYRQVTGMLADEQAIVSVAKAQREGRVLRPPLRSEACARFGWSQWCRHSVDRFDRCEVAGCELRTSDARVR